MSTIEELRAQLAEAEAVEARRAAAARKAREDEQARLAAAEVVPEVQQLHLDPEPEAAEDLPDPEPVSPYARSRHPDEAHELILASGHAVGQHAGLGAGVSN